MTIDYQPNYPSALALQAFLRARGIENESIIINDGGDAGKMGRDITALVRVYGAESRAMVTEHVARQVIRHFRLAWSVHITNVTFLEQRTDRPPGEIAPTILSYYEPSAP